MCKCSNKRRNSMCNECNKHRSKQLNTRLSNNIVTFSILGGNPNKELDRESQQIKVSSEPKGFSYLSKNSQANRQSLLAGNASDKENIDFEFDKYNSDQCQLHSKLIEAYCVDDKSLMCISCILNDNHKKHNLVSVDDAYKLQLGMIDDAMRKTEKCQQNLTDNQSKFYEELKLLENEKEIVINNIKDTFNEICNIIKDYENQLIYKFTIEYSKISAENQRSINLLQSHIKIVKDLNAVESKIKELNKISFLKWSCKNSDFINQILLNPNYEAAKPQITFSKEDELCLLSKLICNKMPFEVLSEKNKTSTQLQPQIVGEKLLGASKPKNTLSKCYSVSTLSSTKSSSIPKCCAPQSSQKVSSGSNTPLKQNKYNLFSHRMEDQQLLDSNKCPDTLMLKIQKNELKKEKLENGNILSFLKKNSKIKGSKLKCAARTQIDLKTLNCNTDEIEDTYFNDSILQTQNINLNERCESSNDNYQTAPHSSRIESCLKNSSSYQSNSFASGVVQMSSSNGPLRGLGIGYNINQFRQK